MPAETFFEGSCGNRSRRGSRGILRLLPYIGLPLLMATLAASWLAQSRVAKAQDFAPINRRHHRRVCDQNQSRT